MKAAVYYNNHNIRVGELPKPTIGKGEILVRMKACGICGSDVLEWYRIKKAPLVLGHEMAGEIVEIGERGEKGELGDNLGGREMANTFSIGDRVFVSHHVPCMRCEYCLNGLHTCCETLHTTNFYPGGFAEFIRVPEMNRKLGTYKLPENISYEEGTFIEPLGCVVRCHRLANMKGAKSLLIIGAGMSGVLHIQLARYLGVKRIAAADISEFKLAMAKRFGADEAYRADEKLSERLKEKFERVIVCAGAPQALQDACTYVGKGGIIVPFAVPPPDVSVSLPLVDFWRNQITIMTSYGAAPRDLEESLELLKEKKIHAKEMITHTFPLAEAGKAFQKVVEGKDSLKVVITNN
ncbi:alcohol dehydrogenase catalytic domain-containing protein [Candidatus Woesearchaeota archaeon]|nr:alcohol dehydrogenase catalytic domain-containing protein [Candidatus Woesearchaeota archaeon]